MKKILVYKTSALFIFIWFSMADASNIYKWNEAHNHIGEHVTVEGVFKYTNNIGKICFLNFHPNFNQYVSVLIFQDYFPLFPENPEIYYYSKKVRVHGKITEFKEKAQIKVYDPKQIEIIGDYERKKPHKEYQCDYPNQLEITTINIGQGDATLIATPSKIVLADVGESSWYSNADALKVDNVIRSKYGSNCRKIDYVINSHFHVDHIGYIYLPEMEGGFPINLKMDILKIGESPYKPIAYGGLAWLVLEEGYQIGQLLVRDYQNHNPNKSPQDGGSKTFRNWKIVLESNEGKQWFNPKIITFEDNPLLIDHISDTPVIIDIVTLDGATPSNLDGCDPGVYFGGEDYKIRGDRSKDKIPPSENDLCLSFILCFGEFQMFIGGDLSGENYEAKYGYRYHNMEECLSNDSYFLENYGKHIEVLKANHHGSSHSCNLNFFQTINPIATIFTVGDHNTYGHVDNDVLDRASILSEIVYLTECGDNIRSENDAACKGVIVIDGEYPDELEIIVSPDGKSFYLQGIHYMVH